MGIWSRRIKKETRRLSRRKERTNSCNRNNNKIIIEGDQRQVKIIALLGKGIRPQKEKWKNWDRIWKSRCYARKGKIRMHFVRTLREVNSCII